MYLGIDPSLTQTGWAVVDAQGQKIATGILSHKLEDANTKEKIKRLVDIELEILALIDKYKIIPSIGIENYAFASKHTNNILNLAELGGILRRALYIKNLDYIEVPPTKVKLFATGQGNCKKDLILLYVFKQFKEEFKTSDEADAFVIAKMIYYVNNKNRLQDFKELTAFQLKALSSLLEEPIKKSAVKQRKPKKVRDSEEV